MNTIHTVVDVKLKAGGFCRFLVSGTPALAEETVRKMIKAGRSVVDELCRTVKAEALDPSQVIAQGSAVPGTEYRRCTIDGVLDDAQEGQK